MLCKRNLVQYFWRCNLNVPALIRHQPEDYFLKKPKHVADNYLNL